MASPAMGMEPKDSVRAAIEGSVDPNEIIAALAYEYWQRRGCPDGSPELDWFQAEADIRSWLQAEDNLKKQAELVREVEATIKDTHSEGKVHTKRTAKVKVKSKRAN